jgi:hypothetical protein
MQASFRVSQGGSTLNLVSCNRSQEFAIGPHGLRQHTLAGEQRGGSEVRRCVSAPGLGGCARSRLLTRATPAAQCSASDMMEFNVIGRGASSVVRSRVQRAVALGASFCVSCADAAPCPLRSRAQVKKAIHVPSHRFVALKCISVLEKARLLRARTHLFCATLTQ